MVKEKQTEVKEKVKKRSVALSTTRGKGTTYSNLYSTAINAGTKYSTIPEKIRVLKKSQRS